MTTTLKTCVRPGCTAPVGRHSRSYCDDHKRAASRISVAKRSGELSAERAELDESQLLALALRAHPSGWKWCPYGDGHFERITPTTWYLRRYRSDGLSGWCRDCTAYNSAKNAKKNRA